ncbi:MAG: glycoside hydrolase family 127 protein, partial [Anaerolineae bacterium]|nr:glycoside hydrolase family 127 protein [Anaerolineae bacterium]
MSTRTFATDEAVQGQFRGAITDVSWSIPPDSPQDDDLDLQRMARAALNYLRGNPDPDRGYECQFSLGPLGIPCQVPGVPPNQYGYDPISLGDTDARMSWQYPHMRAMAGESDPDPVELGVQQRIKSYLREDHLCWLNPAAYVGQPIEGTWATTWTGAKLMHLLAETYKRNGEQSIKQEARDIFMALRRLAQWDGDRAYYMGIAPYKNGEWLTAGWCQQHSRNYPFIVEPCVRYWECTGDEEALDLARAFTEGFLAGIQPDQQELKIDPETGAFEGHTHLHTHAIWGVAHLGAVLGEERYLEWARRVYEFVLANGTDYGWFPEHIPQVEWRAEICTVGDMTSTAVWLARGGWPHYWDHVERIVRNTLRRCQFFLTPQFLDLFRQLHKDEPEETIEAALAELQKLEGGFVAQPAFDDWVGYPKTLGQAGMNTNGLQMMGCCPPEGMRGLWEAWQGVVEDKPEGVFVNMALSRDHPAAKVAASRSKDGQVDITARKAASYLLRPPAWTDRATVRLLRNGQEQTIKWGGPAHAYLVNRAVDPGDVLVVKWAVPQFAQEFTPISVPDRERTLTVRWAGNSVVGV